MSETSAAPTTRLRTPDVALHASWAEAMAAFHAEGPHLHGGGLFHLPESEQWDTTEEGCRRLVETLLAQADEDRVDEDMVPCRYSWIVTDDPERPGEDVVVGVLALRTRLNAWLLDQGGHVGYAVAPAHRRRGHASRALALAVRGAAELGIDRVLVTCDDDNLASAATIERAGGVWEDTRAGKRRYWIETGAPAGS